MFLVSSAAVLRRGSLFIYLFIHLFTYFTCIQYIRTKSLFTLHN